MPQGPGSNLTVRVRFRSQARGRGLEGAGARAAEFRSHLKCSNSIMKVVGHINLFCGQHLGCGNPGCNTQNGKISLVIIWLMVITCFTSVCAQLNRKDQASPTFWTTLFLYSSLLRDPHKCPIDHCFSTGVILHPLFSNVWGRY